MGTRPNTNEVSHDAIIMAIMAIMERERLPREEVASMTPREIIRYIRILKLNTEQT